MPFHFNVELDWNGDGDFADVHENISSEVKAITIEYGRDNDLQKAQAGRARILVRDSNANWFYGNQSSDIVAAYGGIYPARPIRVWAAASYSGEFARYSSHVGQEEKFDASKWQAARLRTWDRVPAVSASGHQGAAILARAVRMLMYRGTSGVGLVATSIQKLANSFPDGTDLVTSYWSGDAVLAGQSSAEWVTAIFTTPGRFEDGVLYGVVCKALSAQGTAGIYWVSKETSATSGGGISSCVTSDAGATWTSYTPAKRHDFLVQGAVVHSLFDGLTDDVAADPSKSARQATIYANDGTDQLQRAKITMALQENKYSDGNSGLVNLALDRAGWPANRRAISSAELDLYPLVHADRQAAKTFLEDIEHSEFGFGYIRNDGYFAWEDRNYRTTWARCTSSQWTCTENEHRNITPISPLAGIINTVILRAQPKTKTADLDVIWSLQENAAGSNSPYLGTGSVTNYWTKYALSGQVPNIAGEVAALISGTDFTANTARDGSGTDKTVQISTAITIFAGSAKLAVTNLSDGAYLTKLQVRGKIYRDDPPLEVVAEDTSSQTAYLERHFEADLPYYSNAATMQAVADAIIAARKNPKAVYEVELINADDTIWEQILARRISDRITLSNSLYNISGDFFIEKIRHEIAEAGKFHRCWWTVTAV